MNHEVQGNVKVTIGHERVVDNGIIEIPLSRVFTGRKIV